MPKNSIISGLCEEIARLQQAKDLLDKILYECAGYGYKIEGMTPETYLAVQRYKDFDDSE